MTAEKIKLFTETIPRSMKKQQNVIDWRIWVSDMYLISMVLQRVPIMIEKIIILCVYRRI